MICFYVRFRALGTRTDALTDLNLASKKRHFALDFYRKCFYVGRVKYNIYNPTGILYSEIIFLSAKTDAAAIISLALLAMRKSTGKQIQVNEAQRHGIGLESNLRCGSERAVGCFRVSGSNRPCNIPCMAGQT